MDSGVALLAQAQAAGLTVRRDGNKLVVRGPRSAEPLAKQLLAAKLDVLAALDLVDGLGPVNLPPDWWQVWEERAAVREHDGGLPREQAEAKALQDVAALMRRAEGV